MASFSSSSSSSSYTPIPNIGFSETIETSSIVFNKCSPLQLLAEKYLWLGNSKTEFTTKSVVTKNVSCPQSSIIKILKIVSYFLIIPPLVALYLQMQASFRHQYPH